MIQDHCTGFIGGLSINLQLPSADKIISKSKATKTVKGVWDKTTASLEMNMAKAQDAMASYQSGKLHDPDKFTCAFFKVIFSPCLMRFL